MDEEQEPIPDNEKPATAAHGRGRSRRRENGRPIQVIDMFFSEDDERDDFSGSRHGGR